MTDKRNTLAQERADRAKIKVRDRRRVRVGKPVDGIVGTPVPSDTAGTVFTSRVRSPLPGEDVLITGANSSKIGGDVLVGDFKGAAIMTLALEERATCPRSCFHWLTCYGNQSPFTTRWKHGEDLEAALSGQIIRELKKRPLLVRLHLLGDFYSWDYLLRWGYLLDMHPHLAAFGFTAHQPGTQMGDGIARLREVYPDRFAIRTSGRLGRWGSATIDFPTERSMIGDALVCPEQIDANRDTPRGKHCGNCAACWQTDRAVIFIEHGNKQRVD